MPPPPEFNAESATVSSHNYSRCLKFYFINSRREVIENSFIKKCPQNISLKSMNWRLDVSISTSSLSRSLEPSIFIEMNLSNGQKISFEMNLSAFHLLRFNVTIVLKEMDDLLNRQMFKLLD